MATLLEQYGKLQQGQVFASLHFADAYLLNGALPKIHDDMGVIMDRVPAAERKGALDLGACHGLLSIRAKRMGWTHVHGIDIDPRSVELYNKHLKMDGVKLTAEKIDCRSPDFPAWLKQTCSGIDTIIARRIFSELFSTTYGKAGKEEIVWRDAGNKFGQAALGAGIKRIIVEGRRWASYKTHANPVYRVDVEIDALGAGWKEVERFKECAILVPA